VSAPDAAAVEAAVRAEDASAVRELLADATEADRRALAKALKPLLAGPEWELPEPIVFTSIVVPAPGRWPGGWSGSTPSTVRSSRSTGP
jgi:hypothetical protein